MRAKLLAVIPSRTRRHRFIDGFLEQEKTPGFTAASMLTTIVVWVFVTVDLLQRPNWGSLGLLVLPLFLGSLINLVVGSVAAARGEYCGGRIAALGIGLWYLTVLIVYLVRGNRLWS